MWLHSTCYFISDLFLIISSFFVKFIMFIVKIICIVFTMVVYTYVHVHAHTHNVQKKLSGKEGYLATFDKMDRT